MKYLLYLTLVLAAAGCESAAKKNTADSAGKAEDQLPVTPGPDSATASFTIDLIEGFPPGIDGCSCYFSENTEDVDARRWLFVSNADSLAFVRISGELQQLRLTSRIETPEGNSELFGNKDWAVTITRATTRRTGDEVNEITGTIRVTSTARGASMTKKFIGECGC